MTPVCAVIAGLTLAAGAPSGTWAASQPAERPAAATTQDSRVSSAATRAIVRLAMIDLRLRETPTPADARVCELLLSMALESDPDNADVLRTACWVADMAEEPEAAQRHLRKMVALDPRDTFSQFRLISARLKSIQNADERLKAYERFLGTEGASLDATIRSKLAYEAATLLLERGDESGSVARLKQATSLDATNKDAAVAAYRYYRTRLTDPAGKADLLANLMMSDPLDVGTHEELARVLASGGAFEAAKRFQTSTASINERAGFQPGTDTVIESLCIDWPIDGPQKAVLELNKALAVRRHDQEKMLKFMEEQLLPMEGLPKPEEVRLDPQLDRLRLLAAVAAGDAETTAAATKDFKDSYETAVHYLNNPPPNVAIDIDDPKAEARALRLERSIVMSWAGVDDEFVEKDVAEVAAAEGQSQDEPGLLEAQGWRLARSTEPLRALEKLKPLAENSASAHVGLATALERAGRTDDAINEYKAIMRDRPMTPEAAWSWHRAAELAGRKTLDPDLEKRLRSIAATIPEWVDNAAKDPALIMDLSAALTGTSLDASQPAAVRVRLVNLAPIPLGVGPGRTIDSRLLLTPLLEVGLSALRQGGSPELLDAERRIRLMPRESIDLVCWPDPGAAGWLAEAFAADTVRSRWRVLQGFTRGAEGQILPGPMCLSAGTQSLVRPPLAETSLSPEQLAQKIAMVPEADLDRCIIAARAVLLSPRQGVSEVPAPGVEPVARVSGSDAEIIAGAFAARYPSCGVLARRMLVAGLPHAIQSPAMAVFDDTARQDTDPSVLALFIVSRVSRVDDDLLKSAQGSGDERLRTIAEIQAERMSVGAPRFGALGPGLKGLWQPPTATAPETPATPGATPTTPPVEPVTQPGADK